MEVSKFKMRFSIFLYVVVISLFWNSACFNDLADVSFSEVVTLKVSGSDYGPELGDITLFGMITDSKQNQVVRQGFIISDNRDNLEENQGDTITVPVITGAETFQTDLKKIDLHRRYFFRAFGEFRNEEIDDIRKAYGEIEEFSFEIIITIPDTILVRNDSATLTASVIGLRDGIEANRHGFVFSDVNPIPVLSQDSSINLEELTDNNPFGHYILSGLSFNTTYYIRAWAETSDTIYYSESVGKAFVKDGWRNIFTSNNITKQDATAIAFGEKAFIIGGCSEFMNCGSGINYNNTWVFDSVSNMLTDLNTDIDPGRHNGVGFAIGEFIYYGLGEYYWNDTSYFNFLDDFNRKNGNTGGWVTDYELSNKISPRSGAVAFTIGNFAYIGTGKGNGYKYFDDFYQFQPGGDVREMSKLPVMLGFQDSIFAGRTDAVAFTLGNFGYVMGGTLSNGRDLRDLWKFEPPDSPMGKGKWIFQKMFEGAPRYDAVAFTIDGKAYICSGFNGSSGRQSDLWEFDPGENKFTKVTSFPLGGRDKALGFSLSNGKGYFGMGESDMQISNNDIWEYTPLKK